MKEGKQNLIRQGIKGERNIRTEKEGRRKGWGEKGEEEEVAKGGRREPSTVREAKGNWQGMKD